MEQAKQVLDAIGDGPSSRPVVRPALSVAPETAAELDAERVRDVLAGVPKRFRGHRLETVGRYLKRPQALDEARAALQGVLDGDVLAVTLVGPSEAGKTSLVGALVAELVDQALAGVRPARRLAMGLVWTDALVLSRARQAHRLGVGEAPLVERALGAALLVVDELGSETVAGADELLDVIWRRWQDERPTFVTTGQTRDRLVQRYGDGVHTRLTKQAQSRLIFCAPPKAKPDIQQPLPLGEPR